MLWCGKYISSPTFSDSELPKAFREATLDTKVPSLLLSPWATAPLYLAVPLSGCPARQLGLQLVFVSWVRSAGSKSSVFGNICYFYLSKPRSFFLLRYNGWHTALGIERLNLNVIRLPEFISSFRKFRWERNMIPQGNRYIQNVGHSAGQLTWFLKLVSDVSKKGELFLIRRPTISHNKTSLWLILCL